MSIADIAIKNRSSSSQGATDDIQEFGYSDQGYESAILRTYCALSNLFTHQGFNNDLATVPLKFHGAVTLFNELQEYSNNTSSYRTIRHRRQNPFFVDILANLLESDTTPNALAEIKAQLATYRTADNGLEEEVVAKYTVIPEVKIIATENYRKEKCFLVFFSSTTYDDRTMDSLLDVEIDLLERFPMQILSFRYIPARSEELYKKHVSDKARILFRG